MLKNRRLLFAQIIFVTTLVIAACFIRYKGFKNGGRYTFDEALYAFMAYEMYHDSSHYNAINYTLRYMQGRPGKKMPEYLFQKLFKHPPLYTFSILMSYRIHEAFGKFNPREVTQEQILSLAVWVSIVMGCATIVVVYLFARKVFGIMPAVLAAIFLTIDPVHWITSQKIWMETTITFFMALAPLLYVYSYKKKEGSVLFFILSGLAAGGATLTKYPGGLILFVVIIYTACTRPNFFKKPLWLLMPLSWFAVMLPWFLWNMEVYGFDIILARDKGFREIKLGYGVILKLIPLLIVCSLAVIAGVYLYRHHKEKLRSFQVPRIMRNKTLWLGIVVVIVIAGLGSSLFDIIGALSLKHEPSTSWRMLFFKDEPWYFYLKRLFIYFPIYIFAYFAPFFISWKEREHRLLPILAVGAIMLFFILWGNFQCRYILPAVPWLLILAAHTVTVLHRRCMAIQRKELKFLLLAVLWCCVAFSMIKAGQIDAVLAWTNKPCYF